jgi:predicted DNA-binding transcriptional regulator AlpA
MSKPSRSRTASTQQALLTGKQAEAVYGPPYRTLYDLYTRGVLPAVRFPGGRRLWFRRTDIEQLIANSSAAA